MYQKYVFLSSSDSLSEVERADDLISLEDLKRELGITTSDDDILWEDRITRASVVIAGLCNRVFSFEDVIETFQYRRGEECGLWPGGFEKPLLLSHYPVNAIVSLEDNGSVLSPAQYEFDHATGRIWRLNGGRWAGRIIVSYNGGYDLPGGAPFALQSAVVQLAREYEFQVTRADSTITREETQHGDTRVSTTFATGGGGTSSGQFVGSGGVPIVIMELIKPYRRIAV